MRNLETIQCKPPLTCRLRAGRLAMCLGISLLFFAAGGCGGPSPAAEFVAQADQLHQQSLGKTVTADKDLQDYFAEIGRRIVAGASATDASLTRDPVLANMRFHLVGSQMINAFDTGGGHIYIYDGLFQLCQDEEELAAVIACEFAHAVSLDLEKTGLKPTPGLSPDRVAYQFVSYPFTGEQQSKAQELAFRFYTRAGWDPARFADIFERLRARNLDAPPVGGRPTLEQCVAAAHDLASKLPVGRGGLQPTVADAQSFKELRERANSSGGELADPISRGWLHLRAFPSTLLPADLPQQRAAQDQLKCDIAPTERRVPIEAS